MLRTFNPPTQEDDYPYFCVWLIPKNQIFQDIIDSQAKKVGTARFDAHITLLIGISPEKPTQLTELLTDIGRKCQTATLNIESVESQPDKTFQCVYAKMEHNEGLTKLRSSVSEAFREHIIMPPATKRRCKCNQNTSQHTDKCSNDGFDPHLSFIYGNSQAVPPPTRLKAVEEITPQLITGGQQSFEADKISLVDCRGDWTKWRIIKEITLAGD